MTEPRRIIIAKAEKYPQYIFVLYEKPYVKSGMPIDMPEPQRLVIIARYQVKSLSGVMIHND